VSFHVLPCGLDLLKGHPDLLLAFIVLKHDVCIIDRIRERIVALIERLLVLLLLLRHGLIRHGLAVGDREGLRGNTVERGSHSGSRLRIVLRRSCVHSSEGLHVRGVTKGITSKEIKGVDLVHIGKVAKKGVLLLHHHLLLRSG
jgi:hypothetical protein